MKMILLCEDFASADDIDTLISHSHRSVIKLTVAATILLDDDGVWYGILLYMYIL